MIPPRGDNRTRRKLIVFALAVILLAIAVWYLQTHIPLVELERQEGRLREAIATNPWRSFAIGFCIYAAIALVPGTGGKGIVCRWLFGFWQGLAIVSVGLAIAAIAIFLLSRYLFRESIERRFPHALDFMNRNLRKDGAFYLVTLRLLHAPFSIVNPVIGGTRVPAWTFLWTTVVGLMPANSLWVYVGIRLPSLRELAEHGPRSLIDLPLIVALVFCGVLPFVIRWLLHRFGYLRSAGRNINQTLHEAKGKDP